MTDNNEFSLNFDTDAAIVVKFVGLHSANMTIHPANVSPIQMIMAGILLQEQGKAAMMRNQFKHDVQEAIREMSNQPQNQIIVPKARINAK